MRPLPRQEARMLRSITTIPPPAPRPQGRLLPLPNLRCQSLELPNLEPLCATPRTLSRLLPSLKCLEAPLKLPVARWCVPHLRPLIQPFSKLRLRHLPAQVLKYLLLPRIRALEPQVGPCCLEPTLPRPRPRCRPRPHLTGLLFLAAPLHPLKLTTW